MSRYIDADKLIIHKFTAQEASHNDMGGAYRQGWNDAIDAVVDNEPTADVVEVVRGEWLHEPYINNTWLQRCSNCSHVAMASCGEECPYNYCPKCGADMRGDKE